MEKNKKLYKLFQSLVSIQTILMGIVFIIQILRIYYGNKKEFTAEICGKYLLQIIPVILIWVALIIASYIYHKLSNSKDLNVSKITNVAKLKIYEGMCPKIDNDNDLFLLNKEESKRKNIWLINIIIIILCSCMGLLYLLNVNHFNSQGNLAKQAVEMTIHLLPWVVISFISLIICFYYENKSALRSIELIKVIINKNGKANNQENIKNDNKKLLIIRVCIICLAITLIIIGIINGGATDVLNKAINICTECIGLG